MSITDNTNQQDNKYRRSMTRTKKRVSCKSNGRKGGRPKQDSNMHMQLPDIQLVVLTPEQYVLLLKKYGCHILNKALVILDKWLTTGGKASEKYVGKNNYAHFRADGWVINEAIRNQNN